MSDDDNVISVDFENPFPISRKWGGKFCAHSRFEVDGDAREVLCRSCGAKLDPVTVLLKLAHNHGAFTSALRELEDMQNRVADLRVEEKRIKARIRSAKKRLGHEEEAS